MAANTAGAEELSADLSAEVARGPGRLVYVSLGTFLSARGGVRATVAAGLRQLGVRAAIATGLTPPSRLGAVPEDWIVATRLPQMGPCGMRQRL